MTYSDNRPKPDRLTRQIGGFFISRNLWGKWYHHPGTCGGRGAGYDICVPIFVRHRARQGTRRKGFGQTVV